MTIPLISPSPPAPALGLSGDDYNALAFPFAAYIEGLGVQLNAFAAAANAIAAMLFRGTSTQSNTIAASGTKSFPTQANLGFGTGQPVMVARTSDPTKYMIGQVGSYDYTNGSFSLNVLKSNGSGTFTDWTITALPDTNALPTSGGVMTGPLTILSYLETVAAPAAGSAFAPNLSSGTLFAFQSNANMTITMPTLSVGQSCLVGVKYGGAHTQSWAGKAVKWPLGIVPTPTSINGKWDIFGFTSLDGTDLLGWQTGANL